MRLRTFVLLSVFSILLLAGCTAPFIPVQQPPGQTCSNVTEFKPVTTEQCGNVSTTNPVCSMRLLHYNVTRLPKTDLCIIGVGCVGKPLSDCPTCTSAMTRCTLVIRNLDPQESGTWSVAANYTIDHSGFDKNPVTATIKPNDTYAFDFQQMYSPGYPTNSAGCNVSIISEAVVQTCHDVTRNVVECNNVTTNTPVQTTVCS